MPDGQLRRVAESGMLQKQPRELVAQTRRLLRGDRARRLAILFACQWLHIRNFDQLDEKSERHFPEFAGLRGAMYEETVRFFTDLFRNDRSILSILDADHTFLDPQLATFYGLPALPSESGWRRVEGLRKHGRGGILGMATTLARQSGASRTSPILRGNWVYETLLGRHLPKPPKDVPQLPDTVPAGLTARQLIEKHSSAAACAKCHVKIDPYGFALEKFDAIGRARGEGEFDTKTKLPDGKRDRRPPRFASVSRERSARRFCSAVLPQIAGVRPWTRYTTFRQATPRHDDGQARREQLPRRHRDRGNRAQPSIPRDSWKFIEWQTLAKCHPRSLRRMRTLWIVRPPTADPKQNGKCGTNPEDCFVTPGPGERKAEGDRSNSGGDHSGRDPDAADGSKPHPPVENADR